MVRSNRVRGCRLDCLPSGTHAVSETCPCMAFVAIFTDTREARYEMKAKIFGRRLQELLDERGWTHERFADLMGLSVSMVSHYKHSRSLPSTELLVDISGVFDVSLDWLMGISDMREIRKVRFGGKISDGEIKVDRAN